MFMPAMPLAQQSHCLLNKKNFVYATEYGYNNIIHTLNKQNKIKQEMKIFWHKLSQFVVECVFI